MLVWKLMTAISKWTFWHEPMRCTRACPRSLADDCQGVWDFLVGARRNFLTPAKNLAVLIDTHNAIMRPSCSVRWPIPVFLLCRWKTLCWNYWAQRYYGLSDGAWFESRNHGRYGYRSYDENGRSGRLAWFYYYGGLAQLVDESFLPVVDASGIFQGIITRKSILKAVNALLHDFS